MRNNNREETSRSNYKEERAFLYSPIFIKKFCRDIEGLIFPPQGEKLWVIVSS